MNNCPKCGNPLQPGITSCPICGTEMANVASAPAQKTVASVAAPTTTASAKVQTVTESAPQPQVSAPVQQEVAQPVAPTPEVVPQVVTVDEPVVSPVVVNETKEVAQAPVSVEAAPSQPVEQAVAVPTATQAPAQPAPAPVAQPAPAPQPVTSETAAQVPVQQPVLVQTEAVAEPVPVAAETPATPQVVSAPAVQAQPVQQPEVVAEPQVTAPAPQPVQTEQQVVVQSVAQPIQPIVVTTPEVTATPEFSSAQVPAAPVQQPVAESADTKKAGKEKKVKEKKVKEPKAPKEPKEKKGINKNVLIIAVFLISVLGVGGFMFANKTLKPKPPAPVVEEVALTGDVVTSNGYKFTLAEGWIITEGNGNVIISNPVNTGDKKEDSTVQMRLSHSTANIEDITEEVIKSYLETNEKLKDSKIEKKQIASKDAYILNATVNDLPIQVYFIGGGSRLLIGVTVVYNTPHTQESYEKTVLQMIETMSFSDDSIKALDVVGMYKDIFSVYSGVVSQSELAVVEEPVQNDPELPETPDEDPNIENNGENKEENPENKPEEDVPQNPTN